MNVRAAVAVPFNTTCLKQKLTCKSRSLWWLSQPWHRPLERSLSTKGSNQCPFLLQIPSEIQSRRFKEHVNQEPLWQKKIRNWLCPPWSNNYGCSQRRISLNLTCMELTLAANLVSSTLELHLKALSRSQDISNSILKMMQKF